MKTRLQKLMADANIASRRGAEQLIERGRVRVNGQIATLGDKADPQTDVIEVDGQRLKFDDQKKIYLALYKPRNVLTTTGEPHRGDERRTVMDLVPYHGHLFTIGRLDADSEGLVVLTNDGELTNKLTHPRYRHTKTYKVTVYGLPSEDVIRRWEDGVWLEDEGRTAPCSVSIVKGGQRETVLRIVMTEGKKRQIRRVAASLGHPVASLVRTQIGQLSVEGLRPGEWRELTPQDVKALNTPSPAIQDIGGRQRRRRSDADSRSDRGAARSRSGSRDNARSDDRPQRGFSDDRPRQRSLVNPDPGDRFERRPRRDGEPSAHGDKPRYSRGDDSRSRSEGERPRYPRRDDQGSRSEGDRLQTGRKPFGSRSGSGQRSTGRPGARPGGSRPRRDDDRSGGRSSGSSRKPPFRGSTHSSTRSSTDKKSGRDDE